MNSIRSLSTNSVLEKGSPVKTNHMKNTKLILPLLVLLAVTLSCKFLGRTFSKDGEAAPRFSNIAGSLPAYDPNAPHPSPGAAALRSLAVLEPKVASLESDVESAERAAVKAVVSDQPSSKEKSVPTSELQEQPKRGTKSMFLGIAHPALFILQGQADSAIGGAHDAGMVGALVSGLSDILVPHLEVGANTSKSMTETSGGATTTMSVEIGKANDGSTKFGLGFKTEASKNGVSAKSELAAKIDGQRCPNAEGQLPFTIKVRLAADSGGTGITRDVTAMVRAVVGDDAQIESYTMELEQGTQQQKDGRQVYVESAVTMNWDGSKYTQSNDRIIRHSSQATAENARPLSEAGLEAAFATGLTALRIAEQTWLSGGCTMIEATSPGAVQPGSNTAIPVTVRHKFDGSEVPSKLETALSGGQSVDPTTLAKTAGTLSYTAPAETGKSAIIKLTATSRRGRATLDLNASTGGQGYTVSGTSGPVTFSGQICSLDKPFVINGTFGNGSETQSFTPSSSTSGTVKEAGNSGGCDQSGAGTYKITLDEAGSGVLEFTETVTGVCGPFSATKTHTFKVTLKPASGLSCP